MKPAGPTYSPPAAARRRSSLVLICLLTFSLAPGVLREPEPAPAVAPADTNQNYLLTWTATADGSFTGDSGGWHVDAYHHIRVSGTATVTIPPLNGQADALISSLKITDEYDGVRTSGCTDGPVPTAVFHSHSLITDPARYTGTHSHTLMELGRTQNPDGTWTIKNLHFAPGLFTYLQTENDRYCGGGGDNTTTYSQSDEFSVVIGGDFNLSSDASGVLFSYHVRRPAPAGSTGVPMTVEWWSNAQLISGQDLAVSRLEVTQGLQDLSNGIALAQGKRTVVRAFISIGGASSPVNNVTGKLQAYSNNSLLGEIQPFNPRGGISAKTFPDWHQIDDTLNFELPHAWTLLPALHLVVTVNPNHAIFETNYDNNTGTADVAPRACLPIQVAYLPIHYTWPGWSGAQDPGPQIATGGTMLRKLYPLNENALLYPQWPGLTWSSQLGGVLPGGAKGAFGLLVELDQIRLRSSPAPQHLFGWFSSGAAQPYLQGTSIFPLGIGEDTPGLYDLILAHELAHQHTLRHNTLTTQGRHWFDVYDRVIKPVPASLPGDDLLDLMYLDVWAKPPSLAVPDDSSAWISPDSYNALLSQFCPATLATPPANPPSQPASGQSPTSGDNLLISGFLSAMTPTTGKLDPLWHSPGLTTSPLPAGSTYCVNLKKSLILLHQYCFDTFIDNHTLTLTLGTPFGMVVPYPAGLNRVELISGTTTLATRLMSASPPTVTLIYPNGSGLNLTGPQTIAWTAGDPDGDPLTYQLLYSRDNGASWLGIGPTITTTTYAFDFSSLPGTSAGGRIKVMASDGFDSAEDQSHNPFTVPDKVPTALILSPPAGQHFNGQTLVPLEGMGLDLEDGSLAASHLSWQSDRDGALGTGQLIEANLSPGLHNVTLTATDSVGLTATTTIQVVVDVGPTHLYLPSVQSGK